MSWDIELSLMCKCGFSTLQPFDRRGAFEFNFKTGTADLTGFFSNDADATDGLKMQSTLKSPTIKYWITKREGTGNYRNKPLFQTNH